MLVSLPCGGGCDDDDEFEDEEDDLAADDEDDGVDDEDEDEDAAAADKSIKVGLATGDSDDSVSIVGDATGSMVGNDSTVGANVVGVIVGWVVLNTVLFAQ